MIFIVYFLKIKALAYFWNTEIFANDDIILTNFGDKET